MTQVERDLEYAMELDECPCCEKDFEGVMRVGRSCGQLDNVCIYRGYVFFHDIPIERTPDDPMVAEYCHYHLKDKGSIFEIPERHPDEQGTGV